MNSVIMDKMNFKLFNLDAISFLKALPNDSIDIIITDPPYESLEKYRAIGTTTRLKKSKKSNNEWFPIFENKRFHELFFEAYRILKKNRHFYLFCDAETMFIVKSIAEEHRFKFWKPLIWDKVNIGMGYHYRNRYEFILFFEKGKRKLNDLSIPDILTARRILKGYPTEKPVELSEILLSQSTKVNELVVDPFMGSGSVGIAAIKMGRKFLGNDIQTLSVKSSTVRLSLVKEQSAWKDMLMPIG